jgi:hypothetical protein
MSLLSLSILEVTSRYIASIPNHSATQSQFSNFSISGEAIVNGTIALAKLVINGQVIINKLLPIINLIDLHEGLATQNLGVPRF